MSNLTPRVPMTPMGYRSLVKELELLENEKLPEAIECLSQTRGNGDKTDFAEYQAAEDHLLSIKDQIDEEKEILTRVVVVNASKDKSKRVDLGSIVHVNANGTNREFVIVGEWEADPSKQKISQESPIGKAFMGKEEGNAVDVESPTGMVTYYIKEIH